MNKQSIKITPDKFSGGWEADGFYHLGTRPQVINILSIPAPKRLWPRLILAKMKRALHVS